MEGRKKGRKEGNANNNNNKRSTWESSYSIACIRRIKSCDLYKLVKQAANRISVHVTCTLQLYWTVVINDNVRVSSLIDPPWRGGVRDSIVTRKTTELVSKEQYKFREASVSETENKVMSHFTHKYLLFLVLF